MVQCKFKKQPKICIYFTCSASEGGASRIPPAPADPVGTAETPLSAVAIIAAVEN